MQVLEPRPARVSAALVEIGDMLLSSPVGENGPRPVRWIGAVTEHVIVERMLDGVKVEAAEWRQWRVQRVDGQPTETTPIPADGWVWVHLPSSDLPAPARSRQEVVIAPIEGSTASVCVNQGHEHFPGDPVLPTCTS